MEGQHYSQIWEAQSSTAVSDNIDESFLVPWLLPPHDVSTSASFQVGGFPSWSMPVKGPEDKASSVSKSHSQAEKRRRDRINAQLGTLRKLIPKSDKMDKAALLGSAVDHVKDLKRKATEVGKSFTIPTEVDEVTVDYDVSQYLSSDNINNDNGTTFIRASVCCDDRPEYFSELIRVLKGHRLSIVRADIASVGGRVKSVLILSSNCSKEEDGGASLISTLKQSLSVVVSRIASSSIPSNFRIRSRRQRFFLPSPHDQ